MSTNPFDKYSDEQLQALLGLETTRPSKKERITAELEKRGVIEPEVVDPEPEAVDPEPEAVDPEPEAVDPEPEVVDPEPEADSPEEIIGTPAANAFEGAEADEPDNLDAGEPESGPKSDAVDRSPDFAWELGEEISVELSAKHKEDAGLIVTGKVIKRKEAKNGNHKYTVLTEKHGKITQAQSTLQRVNL